MDENFWFCVYRGEQGWGVLLKNTDISIMIKQCGYFKRRKAEIEMRNEIFETAPVPKAYFKLAVPALLLSISRQGIIFIVVIVISSMTIGYYGIIASQAVSDVLTAVLAVVLYKTGLGKELNTGSTFPEKEI